MYTLDITLSQVLARLRFAQSTTVLDARTEELITDELSLSKKIIVPKKVVSFSRIMHIRPDEVKLNPSLHIKSHDIYNLLRPCTIAYGFAVSIGSHIAEKRAMYDEQKETTRALVLDAVGSVATEELARLAHREITHEVEQDGKTTTRRFSPGYGDWDLSQHPAFLEWLNAASIGISLTDHFQMMPEKSVSALVGVYDKH